MKKMIMVIMVMATMLTGCGNNQKMTTEEIRQKAKAELETVGIENCDYIEIDTWWDRTCFDAENICGSYLVKAINDEVIEFSDRDIVKHYITYIEVEYDYNGRRVSVKDADLFLPRQTFYYEVVYHEES